jgi:hypothetical protein
MFMAEEEVQAVLQPIETIIDDAREAARTSKDKAENLLKTLRVYVWSAILTVGAREY